MASGPPARWRSARQRAGSVRVRTTLAASLAVAVALTAGAVAVSELQTRTLTRNVDDALRVRADDVGALLADGSLPAVLSERRGDEAFVQVLDARGRVVAASVNIAGEPPLVAGFAPPAGPELRIFEELALDDDPFRVIAQPAGGGTIYVAASLDPVFESRDALNGILLLAVPLLVLLVGALTWLVVGRALSPVEAIRREVSTIGGDDLHRRVPEPAPHDEVGRLARTMNEMLDRLEESQRRQQQFVADASHELRSPLTGIRAQLEVDLAHPEDARPVETERVVLEEAIRLQDLVEGLLELARADAGETAPMEPVDLDDVVLAEIERVRGRDAVAIDARGVSGAQLIGNREQLTRAVRNVLENAARHAFARIAVSLVEEAGTVVLAVTDAGPGVPVEERERIFERFTRLEASRARRSGGAGLGLAIAREIVTRHGGSVAVDAAHSPGARFVLRFPRPAGTP